MILPRWSERREGDHVRTKPRVFPRQSAATVASAHLRRIQFASVTGLLWVVLLNGIGFGARAGFAQSVSFRFFAAPTLVANTGDSEELGEIVLSPDSTCGSSFDTLCVSAAGSILITYTDMVIDNNTATGITVCETLSGVTICNGPGSFLSGVISVSNGDQGGLLSFGIVPGADFALGDQVSIAGVRARITQTPLAIPGSFTEASITAAPLAAAGFSPTSNVIARSEDPLFLSVAAKTLVPCVSAEPAPAVTIREGYATVFVDHGDAGETTFPGSPANARPLFGATNSSRIRLVLVGLVPGIQIQWPPSVPARLGSSVLDLVSQNTDGSEAIYAFGTPDQAQSDVVVDSFELLLTASNFVFTEHDPIHGEVTVQGQMVPFSTAAVERPRYNHPLEPAPPALFLEMRRCNVTTGTLDVTALFNGTFWFGGLDFELQGPTPLARSKVPLRLEGMQPGTYTMNYVSGGPAGATFNGFVQSQTQNLTAGGGRAFTFSFSGSSIASLELQSTPDGLCPTADTGVGTFQLSNLTEDLQIVTAGTQLRFTFSRPVVAPFVASGPAVFTTPVVSGASVTVGLRNGASIVPGNALTFSGVRLDLGGLGDGDPVTVQVEAVPPSAVQLPSSTATLATADTSLCMPPAFAAEGVVNAASFRSGTDGISPGSIGTIFGTNLSNVTGVVQATTLPLPLELAGVSVTVNNHPAPIFAVANVNGQEQINFQYPWEARPGPIDPGGGESGTAIIVVENNGQKSAQVAVNHNRFIAPGIFTTDGIAGAILHGSDFSLVTPSHPAAPGEVVVIFATGLGDVSANPGSGNPALSSPLSETTALPTVTVGGQAATVQFAGLAPGFVGLYQINVELPGNLLSGDQDLIVAFPASGQSSQPVAIAIQ